MSILALAAAFVLAVPIVLADAAADAPNWVSYLLNGGPFAIVLLLIIFDKITTTGERDRLRNENDELRQEIKDLNVSIRNEVMPPLVQLNSVMKDVAAEMGKNSRGRQWPPDWPSQDPGRQ